MRSIDVALDRRLQIDRLLAIDPLRAVVDPADLPGQGELTTDDPLPFPRSLPNAPRLSGDALRLQTLAGPLAPPSNQNSAVRFDVPLLVIESRPLADAKPARIDLAPIATAIDLVAHALDDAAIREPATPVVRSSIETNTTPPIFVPLVLQGLAWDGQEMELIVRRERADETLDNPALDHWCGEVVIDLPELGRVTGHLAFSMQGLRVRLDADDEASVTRLTGATADLAAAFAHIDLRVAGLSVGRPAADAMRSAASLSLDAVFTGSDRGSA